MSNLGNRKTDLLKWWFENQSNNELSFEESYTQYTETREEDLAEQTFRNHLSELKDRGLIESPGYGEYAISSKGKAKAEDLFRDKDTSFSEHQYDLVDELEHYFEVEKQDDFAEQLKNGTTYTLSLDELDRYDHELLEEFEDRPEEFLDAAQLALENACAFDFDPQLEIDFDVDYLSEPITEARSSDRVGDVLKIQGTVETVSKEQKVADEVKFRCQSCTDEIWVKQEGDQISSPFECDCGANRYQPVEKTYMDETIIVVKEETSTNKKIDCRHRTDSLNEDIVETFQPGTKIEVAGVVKVDEKSKKKNRYGREFIEVLAFDQLETSKELSDYSTDEIQAVEEKVGGRVNPFIDFADSIAPGIVGADGMKQVIAASLIGGNTSKRNGRIHSLVFSNPGMGKSDVMKFVRDTFPNTHYADGTKASAVGLTATVEQEKGGRWRLKAGKLVYADGGHLAIDEFDKMDAEDAEKLNTSMMSETFPVDKAGVNAELPGCASVIAAGNFDEYLDEDSFEYIREYIPDHAESLIDRFDLIYAFKQNEDREKTQDAVIDNFSSETKVDKTGFFDEDELVIYRELSQKYDPELNERARDTLKSWIRRQEQTGQGNFQKDSNRYLVSLGMLATMFARSRLSDTAKEEDAERAIDLMEMCRSSRGLSTGESDLSVTRSEKRESKSDLVMQEIQEAGSAVDVQSLVESVPFDESEVEQILEQKKDDGVLFEPEQGKVKQL